MKIKIGQHFAITSILDFFIIPAYVASFHLDET